MNGPLATAGVAPAGFALTLPTSLTDPLLDTPCLLIDLDILAANVARMAALARRSRVALRPHAKTHKSARIARMQLEAGATGICVATVGEAEVMRAAGIADILIAYNIVGDAKLARLLPLCADGGITLTADSLEVAEGYSRMAAAAGRTLPVLLEIDSGMHRTGVEPADGRTARRQDRWPVWHRGHRHPDACRSRP